MIGNFRREFFIFLTNLLTKVLFYEKKNIYLYISKVRHKYLKKNIIKNNIECVAFKVGKLVMFEAIRYIDIICNLKL